MGMLRLAAACVMAIAGTFAATAGAEASTVYTFNFTQDGYVSSLDSDYTGVLSGSFSGTAGGGGIIGLGQLTDFTSTFSISFQGAAFGSESINGVSNLDLFSYTVGDPPSTLDIATTFNIAKDWCVGAAAAFGLCGPTGTSGAVSFAFSLQPIFSTSHLPQITLVSAVTTPIPPALPLVAASLGALGLFGWRRGTLRG